MFKPQNRPTTPGDNENKNQQTSTANIEKTEGTEVSTGKFEE